MAYFDQSDLEMAVGAELVLRLLDDNRDGVVDAGALNQLVEDATAEINGYISHSYPDLARFEANPPRQVRRLSTDVGVQLAYLRRPEFLNERGETPWEGRYKRALEKLREVRDGRFRLDDDGTPDAPTNASSLGVSFGPDDDHPGGVGGGVFSGGFGDF